MIETVAVDGGNPLEAWTLRGSYSEVIRGDRLSV
jgi:hypothetical protein